MPADPAIRFGVLGPLEAVVDGTPLPLGGRKQRAVAAILLLNANRLVPPHQIIAGVWGPAASPNAANTVQVYVSNLRRVFAPAREAAGRRLLRTVDGGYRIELGAGELDLLDFHAAAAGGRRLLEATRYTEAAQRLAAALALWRGPALGDLRDEPFAQAEVTALDELRLATVEARIEADLALGRAAAVVAELHVLVEEHPLRERFRALQMEALHRAGRRADALAAYRAARRTLLDELGVDPGPELRGLERDILADVALSGVHRRDQPFLLFQDGSGHQRVVALDADRSPFVIGRRPDCDLVLGWDQEVSRVHARLERGDGGWTLVDDGTSRNGSFVNGEPVAGRRPLRDAEVIRLGRTVLLYRASAPVPHTATVVPGATAEARFSGP